MNSRRVMREVVVNNNTVHFAANLQPALHAFERRQRTLNDVIGNLQLSGDDDRTQSILHIKCTCHWNCKVPDVRSGANDIECHTVAGCLHVHRLPFTCSNPRSRNS